MFRAASIALVMRVCGTGIWLLYTVAMARLLTQSEFGSVMYAVNLALILAPVATLGFETSTLKHASNYWEQGRLDLFAGLLAQARKMALLGGIVFLAIICAAMLFGAKTPVTGDWLISVLTGLSIVFAALMGIHRDTLRAADRIVWAFLGFSIIRTALPLALSLIAYWLGGLNIHTALLIFCGAVFMSVGIEYIVLKNLGMPKGRLGRKELENHWRVARGTWVGDMAHVILMRGPAVCLGLILDLRALALFLAAERIANLGQFLTDAVRTAAAPQLARACDPSTEPSARVKGIAEVSMMMLKSGAVDACLLAAIGWPVLWLMGTEFTAAYPLILATILVQIGWTIPGPTAMIMNMANLENQRTLWTCLAATALVMGLFLIVPIDQPMIAIFIQATVVWGLNLWQVYQINKGIQVRPGIFGVWSIK